MSNGRGETVGINLEMVKKSVLGVQKNVEQMTVEAVDYYQENVIELLKKGWVTVSGKERIEYIATEFNAINALIQGKALTIINAIEAAAREAAKATGESYTNQGIEIHKKDYSAEGAVDNIDGTHYIIAEYLEQAKDKLNQYVQNRIEKNFVEIMQCASECGLFDRDAVLRGKIINMLTELKDSSIEKINSMISLINDSLTYQSEGAERARATGEAILNISGKI